MSVASQFAADGPDPADTPGTPEYAQKWKIPAAVQAPRDTAGVKVIANEATTPPKEKAAALAQLTQRGTTAPESPSTGPIASQFTADADAPAPAAAKAAAKSPYTPTGSTAENLAAGAGKSVSDLGLGLKQLADMPAKWLENKFPGISKWSQAVGFPSAADSAAATNSEVADSRQRDAPLMHTGSGVVGNLAGTVASTLLPAAGLARVGVPGAVALVNPATYGAAMAGGAVQGALQPTTEDESKLRNMTIGALAGGVGNAVVNGIGRIAAPVGQALAGAHAKAVQVLSDAGIPLDAAQRTGAAFLQKIRSGLSDNPFTAGGQGELQAAQQKGFNQAVLGTIGETGTAATPQVMAAAAKRINGVFSDTLDRTQVNVGNDFPFLNRLTDIQRGALASEKSPVSNFVNRIIGATDQNGQIPGQVAYGIKKELDSLSNTMDSTLNYWARSLNSALKDQMASSMTSADAAAFNQARAQFAKMKTIEPAIDRVGGGDISASKLANTLATKQNRQYSVYGRGDGDLVDLAHSGNMLLNDKAPNSGTASRMAVQLGLGAVGGGAFDASQGDYGAAVKHAAMGAAGLYALPKVAQAAINSPTVGNYLAQGVTGPLRDLMLAPQTNAMVGGAARRLAQPVNNQRLSDLAQQNTP